MRTPKRKQNFPSRPEINPNNKKFGNKEGEIMTQNKDKQGQSDTGGTSSLGKQGAGDKKARDTRQRRARR